MKKHTKATKRSGKKAPKKLVEELSQVLTEVQGLPIKVELVRELAGPSEVEAVEQVIEHARALLAQGVPLSPEGKRVQRELAIHAKRPFGKRGVAILVQHIAEAFPAA